MQRRLAEIAEPDVEAFETEAKVGLLATLGPEGLPHLTLITTLQADFVVTREIGMQRLGRPALLAG